MSYTTVRFFRLYVSINRIIRMATSTATKKKTILTKAARNAHMAVQTTPIDIHLVVMNSLRPYNNNHKKLYTVVTTSWWQ